LIYSSPIIARSVRRLSATTSTGLSGFLEKPLVSLSSKPAASRRASEIRRIAYPIFANLVEGDNATDHILIWSRPQR
jgi:hypothetical protein